MAYDTLSPAGKSELDPELSIRGESLQRIYSYYISEKLIVNRKYQRKLVWNVEEKQKFLDSILKNYPVPLFLLAVVDYADKERYEIIDGMQRLDAITSFMEQEFGIPMEVEGEVKELFFNLDAIADTKLLKDDGRLEQKSPSLDRTVCAKIAGYLLPLSIYRMDTSDEIDEIFRRINSGGRQLSTQEVRQSSSIGGFANIVRLIASKVRGDDSNSDILLLNNMKKISISNKKLMYGINVEEIFWVKQGIILREKMRQSNDEEIIADLLGTMILYPDHFTSNTTLFDNLYGLYSTGSPTQHERYQKIESEINKAPDDWINIFINIYDTIRDVMLETNESFNAVVNPKSTARVSPKHYETIFLVLFEIIIKEGKILNDRVLLLEKFKTAGHRMRISSGAYSGVNKKSNLADIKYLFEGAFRNRLPDEENPATDRWTTRLENILMQSHTEQSLYDFKQGLHNLDEKGEFNDDLLHKIVITLAGMANTGKNITGYVILGIADNDKDAAFIDKYYTNKRKMPYIARQYNTFHITGVNGEASAYYSNFDKYSSKIYDKLRSFTLDRAFIENHVKYYQVNYFDKSLVVFSVTSPGEPVSINNEFYIRNGSNTNKMVGSSLNTLFKRFAKP
jgi:hypothetical protein